MGANEFWLVLLSGVVMGMLLSMSLRWIGRRLLSGNQQKEGGGANIGGDKLKIQPQKK
ncbi:hypothetical protein ES706_06361 [subsurface metagenome]